MSPEQVRGLPIDRRSDVFAVGIILYEMLTGEQLFVGESDFSTLEKVRNAEVPPPRQFNPNIPAGLEKVVLKALARERRGPLPVGARSPGRPDALPPRRRRHLLVASTSRRS